jgi:lipopolysaccharide transport system ATP-binding protein
MSEEIAISLKNVSKCYKRYGHPVDRLKEVLVPRKIHAQEFWALRGINLEISKGETLGIIGQNGSGKSTLLQIIAGTLTPTTGEALVNGRVSALLELGSGFNPEFTGRQNVFFNGRILGLNQEEIEAKFDEIAGFADIGDFIDEPVKTYSSGMFVRLAFAVAVHVEPGIFIVDEALAVGDAMFQHRCMQRIKALKDSGVTILFVSHDSSAILRLCNRAILLEHGSTIKEGDPETIVDFYNALIAQKEGSQIEQVMLNNGKVKTTSGNGKARVKEISLHNAKGEKVEIIGVGDLVELRVCVEVCSSIDSLVLGYSIKDRLGHVMYGTNTWHTKQVIHQPCVGDEYVLIIKFTASLGTGSYSVQTALVDRDTHLTNNYEWCDLALIFNVININKTHFIGCLWNNPEITIQKRK